jgi:hypothetical protein
MIEGASVNVLDFGAVGDGVADDTSAIQAAIDKAKITGTQVWIPPGDYKISNSLNVYENVSLIGANNKLPRNQKKGTRILQSADQHCIVAANAEPNWSVRGIEFKFTGVTSTKAAIYVSLSNSFVLSDLTFWDFEYGYLSNNSWSVTITNVTAIGCRYSFYNGTPGDNTAESGTSHTYTNCWAWYPKQNGAGYTANGLHYSTYLNCYCDHVPTGTVVFRTFQCPSLSFIGCAAEDFLGGSVLDCIETIAQFTGCEFLFFLGNSTATTAFQIGGKISFINCAVRGANNLTNALTTDWWIFYAQGLLGPAPDGSNKSLITIIGNETIGMFYSKRRDALFFGSDSEVVGMYAESRVYDGSPTQYHLLVQTSQGALQYNLYDLSATLYIENGVWTDLAQYTQYIEIKGIYPAQSAANAFVVAPTSYFKFGAVSTNSAAPTVIGSQGGINMLMYYDLVEQMLKVSMSATGQNYSYVISFSYL